jgi:hypothetical protein
MPVRKGLGDNRSDPGQTVQQQPVSANHLGALLRIHWTGSSIYLFVNLAVLGTAKVTDFALAIE